MKYKTVWDIDFNVDSTDIVILVTRIKIGLQNPQLDELTITGQSPVWPDRRISLT